MNVIWFLVDSVRNYHTDADDRGKLTAMDDLSRETIEFSTVVTSAPSSVMAVSSMMTGWPSVYLSRTYYGFRHDRRRFPSLGNILEERGFRNYHVIFFPEGRRLLRGLMAPLERSLWTKGLKEEDFWRNDQLNDILEKILNSPVEDPFFLYVHYDCRRDPAISEKILQAIDRLKKQGLWEDSVFILNSDHGYPDTHRRMKFTEMRKKGHDLIMTDDNILVPLFMRFPGSPVKKIEKTISSLDIAPTILDVLGFNFPSGVDSGHCGKSLLPLINDMSEDRGEAMVRIDNRYVFQRGRVAAVRGDRYKYVCRFRDVGKNLEEFYELCSDPLEERNLIDSSDQETSCQISLFREAFDDYERKLVTYQSQYVAERVKDLVQAHGQPRSVVYYAGGPIIFDSLFIEALAGQIREDLLVILAGEDPVNERLMKTSRVNARWRSVSDPDWLRVTDGYQLAIVPLESPSELENRLIVKRVKALKVAETFYLNYNLEPVPAPRHWFLTGLVKVARRWSVLQKDPKTFFIDLLIKMKKLIKAKQ